MEQSLILKAKKRDRVGSRMSRKIRSQGLLPAIIYGHQQEPVSIQLIYHDFSLELQHHHRLLDIDLDGKQEKLLVKDIQYDHMGDKIVHVDLARVRLDERVEVTVAVELKGIPVGVSEGGTLEQALMGVELECLVTSIPESIRVKVADLKLGQHLLAKDLELPAGAKLITDPESLVAIVRAKTEEVEEVAPAAAVEGAEPEVITARPPKEEEAE
ncbi:MAG: 50S ribosomal protein L25 [Planctomycetes bacterium ADurb.Bin412]|nr:MAG: 50S ribosomal protein L25 [Planctomycetes bacterium ADurb.Bin412]